MFAHTHKEKDKNNIKDMLNLEINKLFPLNLGKYVEVLWYIHDVFDVINNSTKFKLNQIRIQYFQLNLF